jgi:hypothetical protein
MPYQATVCTLYAVDRSDSRHVYTRRLSADIDITTNPMTHQCIQSRHEQRSHHVHMIQTHACIYDQNLSNLAQTLRSYTPLLLCPSSNLDI